VSDDGPPTLSLALRSVLHASVDGSARAGLLHAVHPAPGDQDDADEHPVPGSVPGCGPAIATAPEQRRAGQALRS
jgi:hypothetical protein